VEAMEMSHFGAKVIYPPTIQPALRKGIPIYIRNTFNPAFEGTLIHKEHDPSFKSTIKGISSSGQSVSDPTYKAVE
jgi:aspartokinase/homoserine dehydrogenase 1